MPFVRYARDRRGYETLYVMHAFETAGGRAPRPRVLYACRTVPYAKVGRMAIDESVQRRIETAYPNLSFDWPKLLKEAAQSAPRPERVDPRQEQRKTRGRKKEPRERVERVPKVPPVPSVPEVQFEVPQVPVLVQERDAAGAAGAEATASRPEPLEPITELVEWTPEPEPEPELELRTEPMERVEPAEPEEPAVQEPAVQEELAEVVGPLMIDPAWPAVGVLGEERALILRGRYIEMAHRILSRVEDPAARRRLFREAARLNPEGWQTAEQARTGAAAFEEVYRGLSEQLRRQPPV